MRLAHEFGLWSQPGVTVAALPQATDADLELVHDAGYIAAVRTVSSWAEELGARGLEATQFRYARMFGLGTGDQPVFAGMHHASALVAGGGAATVTPGWRHSPNSCASRIVSSMRIGASGWSGPK